jgi:hypothetical protein
MDNNYMNIIEEIDHFKNPEITILSLNKQDFINYLGLSKKILSKDVDDGKCVIQTNGYIKNIQDKYKLFLKEKNCKLIKSECKRRIKLLAGKGEISDEYWVLVSQNYQDIKSNYIYRYNTDNDNITLEEKVNFDIVNEKLSIKDKLREKSNIIEDSLNQFTIKELENFNVQDDALWSI